MSVLEAVREPETATLVKYAFSAWRFLAKRSWTPFDAEPSEAMRLAVMPPQSTRLKISLKWCALGSSVPFSGAPRS